MEGEGGILPALAPPPPVCSLKAALRPPSLIDIKGDYPGALHEMSADSLVRAMLLQPARKLADKAVRAPFARFINWPSQLSASGNVDAKDVGISRTASYRIRGMIQENRYLARLCFPLLLASLAAG